MDVKFTQRKQFCPKCKKKIGGDGPSECVCFMYEGQEKSDEKKEQEKRRRLSKRFSEFFGEG